MATVVRRIVASPDECNGHPRIEGTRIRVTEVVAAADRGRSPQEIAEALERVSADDVCAALDYHAAHRVEIDASVAEESRISERARRVRAAERTGRMVLRRTRLQDREEDVSPLRGADAVSLVYRLTRESWSLAGLAEPTYARRDIPCSFVPHPRR